MREMTGAAALALACACTSFDTALQEFDAVTGLRTEGRGADGSAPDEVRFLRGEPAYDYDPLRYPWLVRQLDSVGLDGLLRLTVDASPEPTPVDNPVEFARERLDMLGRKAGADLHRMAKAAMRQLWIAQFGSDQPINQITALRGLASLASTCGFDVLAAPLPDAAAATAEQIAAWERQLAAGSPGRRSGELGADERGDYQRALAAITAQPLPEPLDQCRLIFALDRILELERDPQLVQPTRTALVRALYHGVANGLREGLFAASPEVRDAAVRLLFRLGGVDAVPFILAAKAKPIAATGMNRFDDDRFVRLTLVRICGQLQREPATRSVGRGPPAVEYLYETAVRDSDAELRLAALEALALCLGRDVSFDPEWAERWWRDEYVPHGGARRGES
jgi:hypothetical protein